MPVYRYRTHDEAHRARWMKPGDPRIPIALGNALDMGARMWPLARPAGVHKFRTLEEAAAWRASWPRAPR
jgi:hypothetical protein